MKGLTISLSNNCILTNKNTFIQRPTQSTPIQFFTNPKSSKTNPFPSFSINSSKTPTPITDQSNNPPLVVVGSANADIYIEIDRLPKEGETIFNFFGQVGEDAHGDLITRVLEDGGVHLDYLNIVSDAPTGHAVVMNTLI